MTDKITPEIVSRIKKEMDDIRLGIVDPVEIPEDIMAKARALVAEHQASDFTYDEFCRRKDSH